MFFGSFTAALKAPRHPKCGYSKTETAIAMQILASFALEGGSTKQKSASAPGLPGKNTLEMLSDVVK